MLITFEGIDGSGKTTQIKLLKKWLKKQEYQVLVTEEPTNNVVGKELRKLMKIKSHNWVETILFAADRALHTEQIIIPNKDKIVICDRYIHSTLAYQPAMGIDEKWVKCLNKNAVKPDITIYLDAKPEIAIKRINKRAKRTEKYEQISILRKVRKNYQKMKIKKVNAEQSIKQVHEEIKKIISKSLNKN